MKIQQDKILHFIGSAGMTIFFGFFIKIWIAAAIALAIGILKELIHDHLLKRGNCEWGDIYADVAGVLAGVVFLLLLI
jgi:hypothetical protein